MRSIDADALKKDLTRFYDNEVTAKQLIDEQPTIDAIPVEWLQGWRDRLRTMGDYQQDCADSIDFVLRLWQNEQEVDKK